MKRIIFLFFSSLFLGCLLPIASYQLGQGLQTGANNIITAPSMPLPTSTPTTSPLPPKDLLDNTLPETTPTPSNPLSLEALLPSPTSTPQTTPEPIQQNPTLAPLLVYDAGNDEVLTVSVRDYLIGAVASELAMTWPDAALQAQAIACHSYILYCKAHANPDTLQGAYLSADPARRQGFMTDTVLRSYWGTDYTKNYTRLCALVDQVLDIIVLYDGAPAATSYFAISNTVTESSATIWGEALPYLTSVESSWDAAADGFLSIVTYTQAQVQAILYTQFGIVTDGYAPSDYFGAATHTDAGYVAEQTVCGIDISGNKLRNAFSLRSSCFTITYQANSTYLFTTAGYGHGVGLSQWGAKFLAEDGKSYADILAHYFPHTTLGSALALANETT